MIPHAARLAPSIVLILATASLLPAQVAPAPNSDAATLSRFDTDKNGRLDATETRAMQAAVQTSSEAANATAADEPIAMSPFEVVADTKGYFAANTMSGTRLNGKLEDLGSSISVITKEQMADFAMLDINDVFLYANNAEGTGTFTDFLVEDGQGALTDNTSGDPGNANRIRGIGSANVSINNFETSNRVPVDPIDIDGVELSRGSNASIFGLGNPSGTLNLIGAKANVRRNLSTVSFRGDSYDGWRATIDLNRVLLKNKLAIRASGVRQHDGFDLKPSGVDSKRYNLMAQYRPFQNTTIYASYQKYSAHGNRPNSTPPMDGFRDWLAAGAPYWNPMTNTRYLPDGTSMGSSTPAYYYGTANYFAFHVEPDGSVPVFMTANGTSGNLSPLTDPTQSTRKLFVTRALTSSHPLVGRRVEMIPDKSIYDWSSINLATPNRFRDETETTRLNLEQVFFHKDNHSLAGEFGYFRELSERFQRYLLNDGSTAGPTGQMVVDVSQYLLDGTPNPGYMRPMLKVDTPGHRRQPIENTTYRAQLAYMVDFTENKNITKWLGWHGLIGYGEYKEKISRYFRFYDQIISRNPWLLDSNGDVMVFSRARPAVRWYVGDNQGFNVDYSPGQYEYGPYTFTWGDAVKPNGTGLIKEPVVLGEIPTSSSGSRALQRTQGFVLQSKFFDNRIVTTIGRRQDQHSTRFQNPQKRTNGGLSVDYDFVTQVDQSRDWQRREGSTEQKGVVVRPLRWPGIDRAARNGHGLTWFVADALRTFSLKYNRSDSFLPATPAENVYGDWLPDPSGTTKEYGLSMSFFRQKLIVNYNRYRTTELNSRRGPSNKFASQIRGMEYNNNNFGLQDLVGEWTRQIALRDGRTITDQEVIAEIERVTQLPYREIPDSGAVPVAETDNILSKGDEIELHFNPARWLTLTAAVNKKETINTKLSPNITKYISERMPLWTTVIDPLTGKTWWKSNYNNYSETPEVFFRRVVGNPHKVAVASEGLSRPQIRKYSGNVSANLRIGDLIQKLKGFNIGGSMRYESRGAIGYWSVQTPPAIMEDFDHTRPIWDKEHYYFDGFIGYRTRLFSNRVGATFQLNVRNIQENGRLQPIAAGPEGFVTAWRIVAPRQFILTASFDL